MSHPCEFLNIADYQSRIGDSLAKHALRILPEGRIQLRLRSIRRHKDALYAKALQRHGKEIDSAAVDSRRTEDAVTGTAEIQHGEQIRRLAGSGTHGAHAAFHCRNFLLHRIHRRIGKTRIDIGFGGVIKNLPYALRGIKAVGSALHYGHHPRLPVFRLIACMQAQCLILHLCSSSRPYLHDARICPAFRPAAPAPHCSSPAPGRDSASARQI